MASSCSTVPLSKYLEEIDDQNKILPTDEFSTRISKDIESIVQAISNEISKCDGRFNVSWVIRSGSFYSGLKVGKADEFDFMFYLEYFSKAGLFKPTSSHLGNFFDLWVTDEHVDKLRDIVQKYEHSDTTEVQSRTEMEPQLHYQLDVIKFQKHYTSLILNAIQSLEVQQDFPEGWRQSKYYTEIDHLSKNAFGEKKASESSVSSIFLHGPSFTFEFEGSIEGCSETLKVNIDMCPVFSLKDEKNVLEKCGFQLKVDESSWAYSKIVKSLDQDKGLLVLPAQYQEGGGVLMPVWKLSTVLLEDVILQEFDHESIELKSLRILKVLRKERLKKTETKLDKPFQLYTDVLDSMISESVATDTQSDEKAKALQNIYKSFKSYTSALATIHDTHKPNEEDKDCLVSSYQIKLEWLKYMIFKVEKPALTDENLVETVFDILKGFAKFVEATDRSRDVFFNVPISTPQTEDDKKAIITAINNLIQHLESRA